MIAFLKGKTLSVRDRSCVVLTPSGVGYEVHVTTRDLILLPPSGEEVELYTLTVVREDALDLYGFFSLEERETFSTLLSAPKLGPRTALAILGMYEPDRLLKIIQAEDESGLAQVPGIGIKTARRLILDLKDRLQFITPGKEDKPLPAKKTVREDVLAGLTSLGYAPPEIIPFLDRILEDEPDLDVASAIRAVLKKKAAEKMRESSG